MKKFIFLSITLLLVNKISFSQSERYDIREYNDLPYLSKDLVADDSLQRLNLVLPIRKATFPLLIWIGGGAWSYGDRHQEMDLARKMAADGIAVASVGHRLSPAIWRDSTLDTGIQHPKHIEDVATAVKWLYDHTEMYGYDKAHLFIGGYSSGGHLAALISLDSTYLHQVGLSPSIFEGILPISGTYDIVDYHQVLANSGRPELAELHVEAVFGNSEADFQEASPTNYLEQLSIPMLIMSDNNMYHYTQLFEHRIRDTDFREVQVVYAYNLSHGALWRNLSFSEQSIYRTIMVDFIKTHVKMG